MGDLVPVNLLGHAQYKIEVLGPFETLSQSAARLDKLSMWLERGGALWEKMSRAYLAMPANSLVVHMPQNSDERSGMAGQAYGMGNFQCDADEAVVVAFKRQT